MALVRTATLTLAAILRDLVDASDPTNNQLIVTDQWTYQAGAVEKHFGVIFVINGLPLVIGEAMTPTRSAITWFDDAFQINQIYEKEVPAMFVPNVSSFATEGPHLGNPTFVALGERLEKIKERHEKGFLTGLEFLRQILEIAKEVVEAEKEDDSEKERDRAKEALTELFAEAKSKNTHIIVERIVTDIDEIVKKVRFPNWQYSSQGERLVQRELRKALLKYKLHTDQDLFDRAYAYIRQYY